MDFIALLIACLAAVGAGWVDRRSRERFESADTALARGYDDSAVRAALDHHDARIDAIRGELQTLAEKTHDQTLAIAEGIDRVDRAERRVRAAVGRARKRMADLGYADESLDAEAAGLRPIDGDEREPEGMQPMFEGMGGPPPRDMTAFPGEW